MKQVLSILTLLVATWGFATTKPEATIVSVQNLPGSVAAGFHITLSGRKILEKKLNAPGFADLTGHILEQNYRKMQKDFDRLGCELQFYDYPFIPFDDYYTRDEMSFIRGKVPNKNVLKAMSLVAELIQNACAVDEKGLAQAIRSCTGGNRMRASLSTVAGNELRTLLFSEDYPSYPTYFKGPAPNLEMVHKFMKIYFSPTNMIITVLGDVDANALKKSIEKDFSGWGEGSSRIEVHKAKQTIPKKRTASLETRRKSQGYVLLVRPLKDEMNVREIATALLFARQVSDAISFQLREKEGLAYSIGAGVRNIGGHYFLTLGMGTSPKFVISSAYRMDKMLESLLTGGQIAESELQRIRNSLLISRRMKRLTNVNKAFFNGLDLLWNRPQNFEEEVDNSIGKLNVETFEKAKTLLSGPEIRILINAAKESSEQNSGEKESHRKYP
jgi:zinc protease